MPMQRRHLIALGLAWPALASRTARAAEGDDVASALRTGGVVLVMRHALAPGNFDPPGFRLGDCSTQRNLSDEGRAQARRIGEWFKARQLQPARVRTSPWGRCVDTARLAFGAADEWAALGSPRAGSASANADHLRQLRQALVAGSARPGGFEVWVTHNFVLADLVGGAAGSGEGLVLKADAGGAPQVLARLNVN